MKVLNSYESFIKGGLYKHGKINGLFYRFPVFGWNQPVGQAEKALRCCRNQNIDMDGKFVAIKMHFGELGNLAFLRPNYAKAVADLCKEQGGMPFLTDCNTLYPGSRKNALDHLDCANLNGSTRSPPAARSSSVTVFAEPTRWKFRS